MNKDKIVELLNGDHQDLATGLEMLRHLTLGEIFDIMKSLSHTGNARIHCGSMEIDGRNWLIFRLFNIPEGHVTFNWGTWDIKTIRWIGENRNLRPDREKRFIATSPDKKSWVQQDTVDAIVIEQRKRKKQW